MIKNDNVVQPLESLFLMNCLIRKWSQVQNDRKNTITIDESELVINALY